MCYIAQAMAVSVTVPGCELVPHLGPVRDKFGRGTVVETVVLFYSRLQAISKIQGQREGEKISKVRITI